MAARVHNVNDPEMSLCRFVAFNKQWELIALEKYTLNAGPQQRVLVDCFVKGFAEHLDTLVCPVPIHVQSSRILTSCVF